jgi:hypothetical protein
MGVTFRFEPQRYVAAMTQGADRALVELSLALGAEINRLLSTPGRGRVYLRGERTKGDAHLIKQRAVRLAKKAGVRLSLTRHAGGLRAFVSRAETASILRQMRRDRAAGGRAGRGGTLRSLGFHKASAPGDPPAVDSGTLRRSWQTGFGKARPKTEGGKRVIRIGSNVKYARRLEYGGGAIAARPYVAPAMAKIGPTVRPKVAARIQEALNAAGISSWNVAGVSMANRFRGVK